MNQKARDNLIYVGVALTVVAGFTGYGIYAVKTTGEVPDIPGPILWGILSTPGIVALLVERFWDHRRCPALWVISIIAALINISGMMIAYSLQWNPPVIVWSVITVLYVIILFAVAGKYVVRSHS